ncbi:hypothetical protein [Paraburkholderia xenovorans]|uniref:hypothetical protein n=1 Tax=Paraburkholderia xenovorans TaxID=36873 RepID=UPI0038BC2A1E
MAGVIADISRPTVQHVPIVHGTLRTLIDGHRGRIGLRDARLTRYHLAVGRQRLRLAQGWVKYHQRECRGGQTGGTDNGSTNISGGGSDVTAGSSGHGGSGGAAGAAIGAIGAGGLAAFIWADVDAHWYLDQVQPLTMTAGDAAFWADAEVEHVNVDMLAHYADVRLLTHSGPVDRHLAFRDGADGVKHFTYEDKQSQTKADLSVNAETHEFFYTESGVKDGKPYVINSHGWLKHGMDQAFPGHASAVRG